MKKRMEQPFLSQEEKNNIEIDLKFRESMKTDRKATYGSLDTASIKRNEKCQRKASKEISEPSSSSVLQSQDTSDIPFDGSFSSDLEVEPINEPNKRLHRRVVKTGVELFLPADFILHEKLVAAVNELILVPLTKSHFLLLVFKSFIHLI